MAEAVAVVGLIGSIISITDAIKETYKIATEAHKLPQAFAVVNERIPVVQKTLTVVRSVYRGTQDEVAIRQSFTTCKEKAEDLKFIFEKVCVVEGDSTLRTYAKALKTLKPGRGDKVEDLFRDILDTLQTLQVYHIFKNVIPIEELKAALDEVADVESSLPEDKSSRIYSYGSGALFHSGIGDQSPNQQFGSGNYAAGVMHFAGPVVRKTLVRNPTLQDPCHDHMIEEKRVDQSLFIPRTGAVDRLSLSFKRKSRRQGLCRHAVVVHGMGGTGKTQLVLQYIEKHQREYSMVLWIDAASRETFVISCRRICMRLRLSEPKHFYTNDNALVPQRSVAVDHLLSWLKERPDTDNWLVVVDNLDDMSWCITDTMPKGVSGSLIVTSRDSYTASALGFSKFLLESMDQEEASRFLRIAAFRELDDTSDDLEALCAEFSTLVDHLPLAIHLAAGIIGGSHEIRQLDDNITVADACVAVLRHIEEFKSNKDLLLMKNDHKGWKSPYPMTILTTFETTFIKLKEDSGPHTPPSMDFLRMIAFLDDSSVGHLHERFRLAYKGAFSERHRQYATSFLSMWLCKLLTGESSLATSREHAQWDDQGFRNTLNLLQRYGLVGPVGPRSSEILPLHKIIRWRVQKEGESQMLEYLSDYVVLLQLALSSSLQNRDDLLSISDELADLYSVLGRSQDAQECARIHLEKQMEGFGRSHASTIRSLERLIEFLLHQELHDQVAHEVFTFVRDADDRKLLLDAMPANLLLLLNSIFLQHEKATTTNQHALPGRQPESDSSLPMTLFGGGSSQRRGTMWPAHQITLFQPGRKPTAMRKQISNQITSREQALKEQAIKKPDLVTLFEVLSLGSADLIASYMPYISAETVHYRDPVGGRTVLHFVAAYGRPQDVKLCIKNGSDVHAIDRYGDTPIQIAKHHGRPHVFHGLLDRESDTHSTVLGEDALTNFGVEAFQGGKVRSDGIVQGSRKAEREHRLEQASPAQEMSTADLVLSGGCHQPYVEEYESDDSWHSVRDDTGLDLSARDHQTSYVQRVTRDKDAHIPQNLPSASVVATCGQSMDVVSCSNNYGGCSEPGRTLQRTHRGGDTLTSRNDLQLDIGRWLEGEAAYHSASTTHAGSASSAEMSTSTRWDLPLARTASEPAIPSSSTPQAIVLYKTSYDEERGPCSPRSATSVKVEEPHIQDAIENSLDLVRSPDRRQRGLQNTIPELSARSFSHDDSTEVHGSYALALNEDDSIGNAHLYENSIADNASSIRSFTSSAECNVSAGDHPAAAGLQVAEQTYERLSFSDESKTPLADVECERGTVAQPKSAAVETASLQGDVAIEGTNVCKAVQDGSHNTSLSYSNGQLFGSEMLEGKSCQSGHLMFAGEDEEQNHDKTPELEVSPVQPADVFQPPKRPISLDRRSFQSSNMSSSSQSLCIESPMDPSDQMVVTGMSPTLSRAPTDDECEEPTPVIPDSLERCSSKTSGPEVRHKSPDSRVDSTSVVQETGQSTPTISKAMDRRQPRKSVQATAWRRERGQSFLAILWQALTGRGSLATNGVHKSPP